VKGSAGFVKVLGEIFLEGLGVRGSVLEVYGVKGFWDFVPPDVREESKAGWGIVGWGFGGRGAGLEWFEVAGRCGALGPDFEDVFFGLGRFLGSGGGCFEIIIGYCLDVLERVDF
jgi:hypothetical protein